MFSGIIEELGEVKGISRIGKNNLLKIKAERILEDIKIGDSIAVNGACLTLIKKQDNILSFEVMQETFLLANFRSLTIGDKVNLERALKLGDRVSGHFVNGHIDCSGVIRRKNYINNNLCFEITVPLKFMDYVFPKGSIALDGISLTIADKKSGCLRVYVIPHTLKSTTLGFKGHSDKVNVEFDILAKRANVTV
jgi:riboflavin synthase